MTRKGERVFVDEHGFEWRESQLELVDEDELENEEERAASSGPRSIIFPESP